LSLLTLTLFLVGVGALVFGANLLVGGASRLATSFGISPLAVGLTVVAWGTSSPELAVTLRAAMAGQADISLGNIVGSNICNTLLILGLCAAIAPLFVSERIRLWDARVMLGASVLLGAFGYDGRLSRVEGAVLVAVSIGYTIVTLMISRSPAVAVAEAGAAVEAKRKIYVGARMDNFIGIVAGLVLLIIGAQWIVNGAVEFARRLGISELVVGLTVVAVGTSLPEIAASFAATRKGARDIAVGNVVGSNTYNILLVLGAATVLSKEGIAVSPAAFKFDYPVMLAACVVCLPVFYSRGGITRWEGAVFLAHYAAYTVYLILSSVESPALPIFRDVMIVVMVASIVAILFHSVKYWRAERGTEEIRP
jgi:cation:H+ antiporter